jgi:hypothetical protein
MGDGRIMYCHGFSLKRIRRRALSLHRIQAFVALQHSFADECKLIVHW